MSRYLRLMQRTNRIFRLVDRPWRKLRIAEIIEGMVEFRAIFQGQLWVEVMLVKDLNDTEEALSNIAQTLKRIRPDQVHINVPIRPPAEDWVKPPDGEGMIRATAILGEAAPIVMPAEGAFELSDKMPVSDAIVEILRRHPMRETMLIETLSHEGMQPEEIQSTLLALEASQRARTHVYRGQRFWEYGKGRFGSTGTRHRSADNG